MSVILVIHFIKWKPRGAVLNHTRKIVEISKIIEISKIDTTYTHIHVPDHSLSWLGSLV
jgi:hypothetical protein